MNECTASMDWITWSHELLGDKITLSGLKNFVPFCHCLRNLHHRQFAGGGQMVRLFKMSEIQKN